MTWCPQCQIPVSQLGMHRRSVLHQRIRRLRALLANDCLTFLEIGRRLGVSRESIRLMARALGANIGHARRRACTRERRKVPSHLKRIVRRAQEAGLQASLVYTKGNDVTPRALIVEVGRWPSLICGMRSGSPLTGSRHDGGMVRDL